MENKLRNAVKWGRFNAVFGIIISAIQIVSCFGIVTGIIMLMSYIKLNKATDDLKLLEGKEAKTPEEYENVMEKYGEYLKLMGIANIVALVLGIISIILGFLFFGVIVSIIAGAAGGMDIYY